MKGDSGRGWDDALGGARDLAQGSGMGAVWGAGWAALVTVRGARRGTGSGGRCVMASQTVSVPVRQLPLSSHEPGRIALSRLYRSAGIVDERAFPASTSVVMEESCDS